MGIEITDVKPVLVLTSVKDDIYHLFIGYRARAKTDIITLSQEHTEYKWVTKEEFLKLESADFLIETIKLV